MKPAKSFRPPAAHAATLLGSVNLAVQLASAVGRPMKFYFGQRAHRVEPADTYETAHARAYCVASGTVDSPR